MNDLATNPHFAVRYSLDDSYEPDEETLLRAEYESALNGLRRDNPDYQRYLMIQNPYTNEPILTEQDFDFYLRQRAMSVVYGSRYLKVQDEFDRRLELKDAEYTRHEMAFNNKIGYLEDKKAAYKKRFKIAFIAAAALALLLLFTMFGVRPQEKEAAYSEGVAAGYEDGYEAGETAGYGSGKAEGYSDGYSKGEAAGYSTGYEVGDAAGYSRGYSAGQSSAPVVVPGNYDWTSPLVSNTVYVSRNGIIHSNPGCSGMIYYTEMSYNDAIAAGYRRCSKCY